VKAIIVVFSFALLLSGCKATYPEHSTAALLQRIYTVPGHVYCANKNGLKHMLVGTGKVVPKVTYVCKNGTSFSLPSY
jgi:hypothetical protein